MSWRKMIRAVVKLNPKLSIIRIPNAGFRATCSFKVCGLAISSGGYGTNRRVAFAAAISEMVERSTQIQAGLFCTDGLAAHFNENKARQNAHAEAIERYVLDYWSKHKDVFFEIRPLSVFASDFKKCFAVVIPCAGAGVTVALFACYTDGGYAVGCAHRSTYEEAVAKARWELYEHIWFQSIGTYKGCNYGPTLAWQRTKQGSTALNKRLQARGNRRIKLPAKDARSGFLKSTVPGYFVYHHLWEGYVPTRHTQSISI